ncbi:MAG: hypothetical protein ACUVSX_15810 [Aggregatilineales bacterium]
MSQPRYFQFTRRNIVAALLIVLLAFGYRAVIIVERAAAPDHSGAFDPLPPGSDQLTYYSNVFGYRAGTYPPRTFFYQPGMPYLLIGLTELIGTTDLATIRFALAALAALNCGLMIAMTQLALGRAAVSHLAGLLLALYPVAAFYDTDLVIASQATFLLTLTLFGALWLERGAPRAWIGAVLMGAAAGIGAIMRLEVGVVSAALGVWLLWRRGLRRALLPLALAALAGAVFVLPVVLHNRAGGADYAITPVGPTEIYRGWNRDATGVYQATRADLTTRVEPLYYLLLDAQLEPRRIIELALHKVGLFVSRNEAGNNLNYVLSGKNVSTVLRLNPLDFRALLVGAAVGMMALWRDERPTLLLFLLACAAMFAMTLLIWVEARIRLPIIAALIPCAAYGVWRVVTALRGLARPINLRRVAREGPAQRGKRNSAAKFAIVFFALIASLGLAAAAEHNLPNPITRSALPPDAQPVNAVYDDMLRLVGYKIQEQYSPAGYFQPFRPYVVTLYWDVLKPTTIDYSFTLKFLVNGEPLDEFDYPIGAVSYPERRTSVWLPGTIYVEHVGMAVRRFDAPQEISGYLFLTVYPERDFERAVTAAGASLPHLVLARPAVMWGDGAFTTLDAEADAIRPELVFGDLLALQAARVPAGGPPGTELDVVLGWRRSAVPIRDNYAVGVYLQDEAGAFVANFDTPPRNGLLLTSSLPPHYRLEDTRAITLPQTPGVYRVYVAVYHQGSGDRLRINGTSETLGLIGSLEVRQQVS